MANERFELEKLPPADLTPGEFTRSQTRKLGSLGYKNSPEGSYFPDSPKNSPAGSYDYAYNRGDDTVHIRELWRTIRKRKWLIISIVLSITTIVTLEAYRIRPTYQASTTIEIGKDNSTMVRSGDLIINDDSDPFYQVNIKTKILVLNSLELHEDVIANLKLDQNPKFLEVDREKPFMRLFRSIIGKKDEPDEGAEAGAMNDYLADEGPSRSPEERVRLAPFVEVLQENLTVEPVRDTRAIKVSFTHTDPTIAAAVANGMARDFMRRNFQAKTERFTDAASWLDRTTSELKARVEQGEQALATYTRENNIFAIRDDKKENTTLTTDKLTRLHDQVLRAENDRMLKETLYKEVKSGRVAQLPEAFADPKLVELQKQHNELKTVYAQARVKYAPKNPRVVELENQITAVAEQINTGLKQLEAKLQVDYERAVHDEQLLKSALERTKREAAQENQAAIQYNILKQDLDTSRSLYTDFLQKTNQAKAQVAEQHNNIRMIERASLPKKPVGPRRVLMIILGFVVSMGIGVGLVCFLEYIDNTIKSIDDVSRYVQLPALGVIPRFQSSTGRKLSGKNGAGRKALASKGLAMEASRNFKSDQLMAMETRSTAAEAYRALRTSVLLSSAGRPPKTILVTSSQPGEGKTTTCINTAISLAQLGASVLVIDCDLRKPTVHKVLGVDYIHGLSTYLSRDVEVDGLIQKMPIINVSFLACGPIPPNPAELISSEKMTNLLAELAGRYDHILIDSPPLMSVTDPVILSRMVEGVILVVHGGKSSRDLVRRSRQELMGVGAKIFGVVLNNIDLRNEGYDGNYYYYGYGQEGAQARV